jgi:hypothetical protein
MSIADQLDAEMRAQLRSRYRPLPPMMPPVMAGPVVEPMKGARPPVVRRPPPKSPHAPLPERHPNANVSIKDIMELVASLTGVSADEMRAKTRALRIVPARHVAMYLALRYTKLSGVAIGGAFCRDHTVTIHAGRKVNGALARGDEWTTDIVTRAEAALAQR